MKEISMDVLLTRTESIYKLCNLAAMRAMELNSGFKKLVEADPGEKVTTVAIKEIAEHKVKMKAL